MAKAGVDSRLVEKVFIGCVLQAGIGQSPARQAALGAGISIKANSVTINKVCGSGLEAVIMASQAVKLGDIDIAVAGGMENMTRAPKIFERTVKDFREEKPKDHLFFDGLTDAYSKLLMGNCAELFAQRYNISKESQDNFAETSYSRAIKAMVMGYFSREIIPIIIKKDKIIVNDEELTKYNPNGVRAKPCFKEGGTITLFNASKISDGAASIIVLSKKKAGELNLKPEARILGYSEGTSKPEWFVDAQISAIEKIFKKVIPKEKIDFLEINEAFALVPLIVMKELRIDVEKVNVHGGAVALGHPIGASGCRILVTLLNALKIYDKKIGVASCCIGGGEAIALAIERL